MRPPQVARRGFTLIELLVVVAIIALLISILLPSLRAAQEQARMATCGSQLRDFGNALAVYVNNEEDWLPGVNTSGVSTQSLKFIWNSDLGRLCRPQIPVQTWDWMTPILSSATQLSSSRAERFKFYFDKRRCPSQRYNAVPWAGESGSPGLGGCPDAADISRQSPYTAVSYLMPAGFQFMGEERSNEVVGYYEKQGGAPSPIYARVVPSGFEYRAFDFTPRIDRVGESARKIFVADGLRYLDIQSDMLDFDPYPIPTWFGAFSDGGAWWSGSAAYGVRPGSPNWCDQSVPGSTDVRGRTLALSYRHGATQGALSGDARDNKGKLEALCFDGHVSALTDRKSREVYYWYPSGSLIVKPAEGMSCVPTEFIVP